MAKHVYSVEDVVLVMSKTNPPTLYIRAKGSASTTGWTNPQLAARKYIDPPPDGIYEFDFVADPPSGIVLPVLTPIYADTAWKVDLTTVKGIRVHAETNSKEKLLGKVKEYEGVEAAKAMASAAGGVGTFPW